MRARSRPAFVLAVLGLGLCLAAISLMASQDGTLTMLDMHLNRALSPLRTSGLLLIAEWISAIGNPITAAALVMVSMVWFWTTGRRAAVLGLALLVAFVPLSIEGLKAIVARPRPEPLAGIVETDFSFPSGTATIVSAVFGCLAYLLGRQSNSARLHWALAGFVVLLVTTVGLSRLVLSVHYFSDVVAGAALGTLCMLISLAIANRLNRRRI